MRSIIGNRCGVVQTTLVLLSLNCLEQTSEAFVSPIPATLRIQRDSSIGTDAIRSIPQTSLSIQSSINRRDSVSTTLNESKTKGDDDTSILTVDEDETNGKNSTILKTDEGNKKGGVNGSSESKTKGDDDISIVTIDDGTNGKNSTILNTDEGGKKGGVNGNEDGSKTEPSKLRRLKDRMWVRETLEDITAAEFACSLAVNNIPTSSLGKAKKIKRAVDFENLLAELDRRVEEMCVRTTYEDALVDVESCYPLDHTAASNANPDPNEECWTLQDTVGMGSMTYTHDQRSALIARILEARQIILKTMEGNVQTEANIDLDEIREQLNPDDPITDNNNEQQQQTGEPLLYVREDGSVDWDGALQDRAALGKIGASVWARINGVNPESIDTYSDDGSPKLDESHGSHSKEPVTAKIMETDAIRDKKAALDALLILYDKLEAEHMALLSSAVDAGSAVAEVKLATVEPSLRSKIRKSSNALERKQYEISFQMLNYELERIYTYLTTDLGNISANGYIPLQDRLNVAEFGLLESQIENLNRQMAKGELVDTEVLSVVLDQTNDFKRRLGIDYVVSGFTLDREGIVTWLNEVVEKGKKGVIFYSKGVQLLSNDVVFSSSLIGRALTQGYTLKPREVRTLRRTFKDVLTFIPFVIILIIPLTPVGHVLVFGAIQRFFPNFFPTCFTERRQNLLSLYETTEFKGITIDENWKEKIYRAIAAVGYTIGDIFNGEKDEDEISK